MKAFSPAAERNQGPIFEVLNPFLPSKAAVLEVASGTGQHADFFCTQRPDIMWQPTDPDPSSLLSLETYCAESGHPGMKKPKAWSVFDALPPELDRRFDAVVNINMIHISPWEACLALLDHTRNWLAPGGVLYLYGPFVREGRPTAASNLAFHQSLQERDARWGLRELETVMAAARDRGLRWLKTVDMPANNVSVLFQK
jgi:cyclopropane fatty-acyl-phospholipid synthase-like methyltransferase